MAASFLKDPLNFFGPSLPSQADVLELSRNKVRGPCLATNLAERRTASVGIEVILKHLLLKLV